MPSDCKRLTGTLRDLETRASRAHRWGLVVIV